MVCRIRGFARARGEGGFELKLNIRRWRNHTGKDWPGSDTEVDVKGVG